MPYRPASRFCALVAVSALCIALSACGGSPASDGVGALVVRDGSLRALNSDCSGSGPYLFIHSKAELTITDTSGKRVETTTLDAGKAIAADTKDYGNARRIPSYCSFTFPATALESGATYTFTVDGTVLGELPYTEGPTGPEPIAYPALGESPAPKEEPST